MKDNFVWGEIQPSDMRFHKDILKLGKLEISKKNNHIDVFFFDISCPAFENVNIVFEHNHFLP